MKNLPWLLCALGIAVVGCVVVWFVIMDDDDAPNPATGSHSNESESDGGSGTQTPEQEAANKMQSLKDPQDRIAHLEWIAKQPWARSFLPLIRSTIISDPDEAVQIKALEIALELAKGETVGAPADVIRTGLAASRDNTRAKALAESKKQANPALVPEMLELVENNDKYAAMALNTLAFTETERGHAKILEIAKDEEAKPNLRKRAITLLAVTKDPDGHSLLVELARGEDDELRKLATEVLKAWRQ